MTQPQTTDQPTVAPISDQIEPPESTRPGFFRRLGRGLWTLLRILLILAVLAGIGAAIFYGWPIVKERYLDPIAANSSAVQTAESRLEASEIRIADLEAQVTSLQEADLEVPGRLDAVEGDLAALLDTTDSLDGRLGTIERQIDRHTTRLDSLGELQTALSADLGAVSDEATRQVDLLRSTELLSRARLFLFQANYGLARADLAAAQAILTDVQAANPDWEPTVMAEVIDRVERSLGALPQFPVAAADDLDIAWQVLLTQVAPEPLPAETPEGAPQDAPAATDAG